MSNFDIQTSQNVNVEYKLAGLGNRIAAAAIDYSMFFAWLLLITFIAGFSSDTLGPLVFLLYVPLFIYNLLMEVLMNGQSLGKMAMKIRVMKIDGSSPTLTSYVLRWIFRLADIAISFGGIAIILIAFTDKAQRLGDLAAGTTVISDKRKTKLQELIPVVSNEEYQPSFEEVITLSDQDIGLIKKVLHKYKSSKDLNLLKKMAFHIKNKSGITTDMSDIQFLQAVLHDYEYRSTHEKSVI
ncbi:MAG: RDD family protein [Lentimicrobium sp.]